MVAIPLTSDTELLSVSGVVGGVFYELIWKGMHWQPIKILINQWKCCLSDDSYFWSVILGIIIHHGRVDFLAQGDRALQS